MKSLHNFLVLLTILALSGCGQPVTLDDIRSQNTTISVESTDTKLVSIYLTTPDLVTTVQTELAFDPAFLKISELSAGNSPFNIRLKETVGHDTLTVSAASLKPGQTGKIKIAEFRVEPLQNGTTTIAVNRLSSHLLTGEREWGFQTHDLNLTFP